MKDKVFSPLKEIADADKIHTIEDEILGRVQYTPLTVADMFAVNSMKDQKAKTREILFRLLCRANPMLKREDLDKLPMTTTARLLKILVPVEATK